MLFELFFCATLLQRAVAFEKSDSIVCVRACIFRRGARCRMQDWIDLAFPVHLQSSDPSFWRDFSFFGESFVCLFDKLVVVHTR